MKLALLVWAATLSAQTRDIPIHGANLLRAEGNAQVTVGDGRVELRRGKVLYRIVDSGAPPVELVTPVVTVHPYLTGDYVVEVKRSGETSIVPRGGEVKVSAPQGSEWLPVGKKMIARGPASNPRFKVVSALTGWRWIAAALQSASSSGGSASVDSSVSTSSDDSSAPSRGPIGPPPSSPPSSVSAGAAAGETRSGSMPSRGK